MVIPNVAAHIKKVEFSKKAIIYLLTLNTVLIVFSMVMMIITCDLTPLIYICPSVGAQVAAGLAFYYWKAKNENRAKFAQKFILEFADKYGIDMAIRIAEMVSKD